MYILREPIPSGRSHTHYFGTAATLKYDAVSSSAWGARGSAEPETTLTAAELREKENRRQLRLAGEQERARQQAKRDERRRADQEVALRFAEQRRQQDIEAREAVLRQQESAKPEQARDKREQGVRMPESGRIDPEHALNRPFDQQKSAGSPDRSNVTIRRHTVFHKADRDQLWRPNGGSETTESKRYRKSFAQERVAHPEPNTRVRRLDSEVHSEKQTTRVVPRMEMPNLGTGSFQSKVQANTGSGWGSGNADIKPLEYAEEEERSAKEVETRSQEYSPFEPSMTAPEYRSSTIGGISPGLNPNRGARRPSNRYRSEGPSINKDNFWSTSEAFNEPARSPRTSVSWDSGFGGTSYRATPFNYVDEHASSADSFDGDRPDHAQQGTWNHLRQKGARSEPPLPPLEQPSQQPQQRQGSYSRSQDEIDRIFSAHQAERPQRRLRIFKNDASSAQETSQSYRPISTATRKCARCSEIGHHARDCPAPPAQVKAVCHTCGQVGHMNYECPQNRPPRSRDGGPTPSRDLFDESEAITFRPMQPRMQGSMQGLEKERELRQTRPGSSSMDAEEDAEDSDRQARRSKRGFEDAEEATATSQTGLRDRRKSRRSMEREDDEAADEANALREERAARKSARKAARQRAADNADQQPTPLPLPEFITVSQLAQVLDVRYEHLLRRLEEEGYDDVFPGKVLNMETSGMIAMEYNFEPQFEYDSAVAREEHERDLRPRPEATDKSLLPARPPVVTIMGHVDHGKTTILDFLRKSSVAAGEAGGITQHIGAFSVPMSSSGRTITFLDTPGHAAFLAMRQRGANVTDIVVLVVAADDSVKPQTLESLKCAREAGVPILVAINKVDKDGADVQRVKQDLAKNGVEIEDFGGDVQTVSVSGKTGQGMEDFEETIVTLSEVLDHRAETDGDVEGWVLEATTKTNGRVATVLVKRGTLRVGQVLVAGKTWARVRTLKNERGEALMEVGPGMPVEVDGWREQAVAGDQVLQAPNEQKAGTVVDYRTEIADREKMNEDMEAINETRRRDQEKRAKEKAAELAEKRRKSALDDPLAPAPEAQQNGPTSPGQTTMPFIIKADVSGSAEAVAAYIPSLTNPFMSPQILASAVGPVNESDIEYAATTQGHIIAFNLPQNSEAAGLAESKGVKIVENDVIYRVLDQVKEILEEKLPPIVTQRVLGEAEIGASFEIGIGGRKKLKIAGCRVRNGVVGLKNRVRVMRGGVGGEKVYDGLLTSLKNVKKDVQEMRKGTECGMGFDSWEDFEVGDVVQTYEELSEKRRL